jgi:hypothetical protein
MTRVPGYLRHSATNRGYSRLNGRNGRPTYFPGPHGSPESAAAYRAALAEWIGRHKSCGVSPVDRPRTARRVDV